MNLHEKAQALIEVAHAYLDRGSYIQYDQRCMDRSLFLTPRRIKLIPPEAATEQKTLYLDCSSYVGALFYEAFGYELDYDLTWHMVDYVGPRVYYYELTHSETDEEKEKICDNIREVLKPGDVITYDRGVGSGHTMLYVGDGKFTHCTSRGPDSYDYVNKKSREYDGGGLSIADLSTLLNDKRLFNERSRRVSIARPLLSVGDPTQRTAARVGWAKGLYSSVTVSHPGCKTARRGEPIYYKLTVKDRLGKARGLRARVALSDTLTPLSQTELLLRIPSNGEASATFKIGTGKFTEDVIKDVRIYLEDMEIHVPEIGIGEHLGTDEADFVISQVKQCDTGDLYRAINDAYQAIGIDIYPSPTAALRSLFYLHDAPSGDVLSRKKQTPRTDMAVYSFFGGTGVVTPEMISDRFIRINNIRLRDLAIGDILIVSDDAYGNKTTAFLYTGSSLICDSTDNSCFSELDAEKTERTIDSLLGSFCFFLLRPSLVKKADPLSFIF